MKIKPLRLGLQETDGRKMKNLTNDLALHDRPSGWLASLRALREEDQQRAIKAHRIKKAKEKKSGKKTILDMFSPEQRKLMGF